MRDTDARRLEANLKKIQIMDKNVMDVDNRLSTIAKYEAFWDVNMLE